MDANRYFDAMHNAMSAQHPGAQLLLTVKLQDTCGNDACLELKQLPGESTSILCYSTMGRRCLNFQLFRKGWQLCHNADGQLVGRFPSSADGLIDETDFRAYCREDRLDMARTQRITAELRQCAGINYQGSIPQNARTGAVITVESFVGAGARWTKKGMPFRDAYKLTGCMVSDCIAKDKTLEELTLDEFKGYSALFENDIYDAIDLVKCCEGRTSYGGPSEASVKNQIELAAAQLNAWEANNA